jgi:hypothetical protein
VKTEKDYIDYSKQEVIRAECRSLILLYKEVMRRNNQEKYEFCVENGESWYKNVADAYMTSHWDALRAVRDRINELTKADWRLRQGKR